MMKVKVNHTATSNLEQLGALKQTQGQKPILIIFSYLITPFDVLVCGILAIVQFLIVD